jgi:hypothetical protein
MLACSVPFMSAAPPPSVLTAATPTDPPYTETPYSNPALMDALLTRRQSSWISRCAFRAHATDGAGITRIEYKGQGASVTAITHRAKGFCGCWNIVRRKLNPIITLDGD